MKLLGTYSIVMLLSFCFSVIGFAQDDPEVGDYRTNNSGNWSNAQIWHSWNGNTWGPIGTPPTGEETITVLEGDSVFVNVELEITGKLVNQGRVHVEEEGYLTIADGGIYQHDRDEGNMPLTVWEEGATFLLTGITATAPADRNQNYYNIVFDTPDLLANLNMDLNGVTIGGDITVLSSGFGRWYLTSVDPQDTSVITINGDVIVEDGAFSVHGTSNALTTFIVHHYGDVVVTGGNFSISRGSQGGGTTTWYLHEGDFSMSNATTQNSTTTVGGAKFVFAHQGVQTLTLGEGNTLSSLPIEVASGTTLHMGESALAGGGTFDLREGAVLGTALAGGVNSIFSGVVGEVNLASSSGFEFNGTDAQSTGTMMPDTVGDLIIRNPEGVTLSQETHIVGMLGLGEGVFDNSAGFTRGADFMLGTGHPDGIAAVDDLLVEAEDFDDVENFAFIGVAEQVTSEAMPPTVNNLNINNSTTVTLSQETTINGVLRLMAGLFDNTVGHQLGPNGSISFEGGSIAVSARDRDLTVPESFYVNQNYPNPFNPSTMIRFGLSSASHVTVTVFNMLGQEVAILVDDWKNAGQYEITFDAGSLSSGVYLYRVQAGDAVTTKRMMLIK